MKKFKKIVSVIICAMMVTAVFTGAVSAAEASTEATTAEETAETENNEIVDGTEEELPEEWYILFTEERLHYFDD